MFKIELRPLARNAVDQLLHSRSVFRVSSLHYQFNRNLGCRLIFKYPKGFRRPVDLSAAHIPAEATCMTEFLSFRQVRFAALEFLSQAFLLCYVYGSADDAFQHAF